MERKSHFKEHNNIINVKEYIPSSRSKEYNEKTSSSKDNDDNEPLMHKLLFMYIKKETILTPPNNEIELLLSSIKSILPPGYTILSPFLFSLTDSYITGITNIDVTEDPAPILSLDLTDYSIVNQNYVNLLTRNYINYSAANF